MTVFFGLDFHLFHQMLLLTVRLKIAFEEKLQSDADFKQEFEIYKALETSLSSKFKNEEAETALRNTLSELGSKYIKEDKIKKETRVVSLIRYRKLMVAASIALLIGFFIFRNGTPVYGDFSKHNNLELVVRGDNNETIKKALMNTFNKNNSTTFLFSTHDPAVIKFAKKIIILIFFFKNIII